jgi:mono/diheme cytochrome c family protein
MTKKLGVLLAALFLSSVIAATGQLAQADQKQHYSSKQIARGKYLVESVAMCGTCHTPVNEKGEPDGTKWLHGSPLNCAPINPIPDWRGAAPRITPLPPQKDWTGPLVVRLLETGISHNGKPAKPPMPQFRMSPRDAEAVVAYLMSLGDAK